MSIDAFTGTPGSGKTYDAVAKIIDNLRMGRMVYTNIRGLDNPGCLKMIQMLTGLSDCWLAHYLHFLDGEQVFEFWQHVPPRSLIVLDEVQNIFNARDWQSKKNIYFNAWASTHRHLGFDLILITQSIQRLDTAVRALVEWTHSYRKMNFFGSLVKKKYLHYMYAGEDVSGPPLAKSYHTYDPQIFLCYQSYMFKDIAEKRVMQHVNVLNHPVFWAIPAVFCFFIYMLFHSGMIRGDLFGAEKLAAQQAKNSGKSSASSAPLRNAYSPHTPSIWIDRTKSGQLLFSNRGSDVADKDKNDQGKKNDAKPPKKT
jgi:zona occludens toxin (predicted ATPase)